MNGRRKEGEGNSPILLKLGQEEVPDPDEVTDAITKLQQNGVNCIFFTKKELINLNNNHMKAKVLFKNNSMRMTKESSHLNDLLDYGSDIKSINSSSMTIQLNHKCLVTPKRTTGKQRRGRRKGNMTTKRSPGRNRKRCNDSTNGVAKNLAVYEMEASGNVTEEIFREAPDIKEDDQIHHDYLNYGFSTPPPCLSPQCSEDELSARRLLSPRRTLTLQVRNETEEDQCPPLSCPHSILFDDSGSNHSGITDAITETMGSIVESVVRKSEMDLEGIGEDNYDYQFSDPSHNELNLVKEITDKPRKMSDDEADEVDNHHAKEAAHGVVNGSDSLESSLPPVEDSDMQSLHSTPDGSFYSLVTNNVRYNLENYLDGRVTLPPKKVKGFKAKRRKCFKNGYLLYHGDNYPQDPELSYKLNLTTQILLKLNRKRFQKPKSKSDKRKSMLASLNLISKRPVRTGKNIKPEEIKAASSFEDPVEERSLFSGEWTLENKYICGICRHEEIDFWDMVTHKGEEHSSVLVTHVELPVTRKVPKTLIRETAQAGVSSSPDLKSVPVCTKCAAKFSTFPDLHRHIFECSGNTDWLQAKTVKKPSKGRRRRRQDFKRRLSSNTPKKPSSTATDSPTNKVETPTKHKGPLTAGSTTNLYKCKFCIRHFKTEGWLKNHQATHTLLVSIPFSKLPKQNPPLALPQLPKGRGPSNWSLRRFTRSLVTAQ